MTNRKGNRRRKAMTAMEATSFDHESIENMAAWYEWQQAKNEALDLDGEDMLTAEAPICECEPYQNVFTYARWQALGFQVRRGEHGCKITTWVKLDREDPESKLIPRTTTVFCRCQVDKVEASKAEE